MYDFFFRDFAVGQCLSSIFYEKVKLLRTSMVLSWPNDHKLAEDEGCLTQTTMERKSEVWIASDCC